MRVLLINPGLRHTLPQLEFMVEAGVDVHCLNIRPGARLDLPGIANYDWFDQGKRVSTLGKVAFFWLGLRARKFIRWLQPDIVHAHYATSAGMVAYLSGFRPYAVTIHGSDLLQRGRTAMGRAMLRPVLGSAELVNPVAAHMVGILRHLGVREDRVLSMPFGLDLPKLPFVPRSNRFSDGPRLLCTRSLAAPVYDVPTLLRGLAKARAQGSSASLTLAATGGLSAELKDLAAQLGLRQAVRFGNGYSVDELPALMSEHDLYVSSSLSDGASVSLMEAMACGIPPLLSDIPANREWIDDGRNGWLFPLGDADALAKLILEIPARRDVVERLVEANRHLVEVRADRQRNLATLLERLSCIAEAKRRKE